MCECVGPGDNQHAGNGKRIEKGRYPLWTQFGRYRSMGYSTNTTVPADGHMPGIRLEGTGNRIGILIHPGHPPKLYLSSIGCLNPTTALAPHDVMDFWDSRRRVIALLDDLRDFAPDAFAHETANRIARNFAVIDGEPTASTTTSPATLAAIEPPDLPISETAARKTAEWLMENFGRALKDAVRGKAYKKKHLSAIVCQETAYKWLKWADNFTPAQILGLCVFDASGDYPGTSRSAFPKNTAAFRQRYGTQFTGMLIEEANKARRVQGWDNKQWVYKGYGIFQELGAQEVILGRSATFPPDFQAESFALRWGAVEPSGATPVLVRVLSATEEHRFEI
jgi:hypothetical protein